MRGGGYITLPFDAGASHDHDGVVGDRLKQLIADYGGIAFAIYMVIFVGTLVSFWATINAGVEVDGAAAGAGTWAAAWVATKLTQPVRIGVTLVLTPIVAKLFGVKGKSVVEAKGESAPVDPKVLESVH